MALEPKPGLAAKPLCILVGMDGSETSMRAGVYAAGLARRQQARLTCLFVYSTSALTSMAPEATSALRQAQQEVCEEIRQLMTGAPYAGLAVELVERTGNPYRELVQLADTLRADAVVVGASMQAGHRLVGSLAVHLVREARWPVTVVP